MAALIPIKHRTLIAEGDADYYHFQWIWTHDNKLSWIKIFKEKVTIGSELNYFSNAPATVSPQRLFSIADLICDKKTDNSKEQQLDQPFLLPAPKSLNISLLTTEDGKINFQDNFDPVLLLQLRYNYQRKVAQGFFNAVRLQDIKDIVTFSASVESPVYFLHLFHSTRINPFLRSLIIYFQQYLLVWDDLVYRRTFIGEKLNHPIAAEKEKRCMKLLNDLQCRVGQEYAALITGAEGFRQFYHLESSKDIMLYELLYAFSIRVIWIALNRANFHQIEVELSRLFRSDAFNKAKHKDQIKLSKREQQVLQGDTLQGGSRLFWVSPAIWQTIIAPDINWLQQRTIPVSEKLKSCKIRYLEALFIIPEELLSKFNIVLGILGCCRDNYDPVLNIKEDHEGKLSETEELLLMQKEIQKPKPTPVCVLMESLNQIESFVDIPDSVEIEGTSMDFIEAIQYVNKLHKRDETTARKLWLRTFNK